MAVVLLDTEGEYVHIDEPTDDPQMKRALADLGLSASGVDGTWLYHLAETDTANPDHPRRSRSAWRLRHCRPTRQLRSSA